jgi:hypothetical protein
LVQTLPFPLILCRRFVCSAHTCTDATPRQMDNPPPPPQLPLCTDTHRQQIAGIPRRPLCLPIAVTEDRPARMKCHDVSAKKTLERT